MKVVTVCIEEIEARISGIREQAAELTAEADRLQLLRDLADQYGEDIAMPRSARKTRKQEIIDFLASAGPHSRKDIAFITNIPEGTLAYEMRDRDTFVELPDGTWDLKTSETKIPMPRRMQRPPASAEEFDAGVTEDDVPF